MAVNGKNGDNDTERFALSLSLTRHLRGRPAHSQWFAGQGLVYQRTVDCSTGGYRVFLMMRLLGDLRRVGVAGVVAELFR